MEPAIKPAAENTRTGIVGVLATPATFQGALYASVIERFASNVLVVQNTCPGLVQQIERGAIEADETRTILESAILPMMDQGIDTIVLGCTHYPFVIPLINEIVGPDVRVIDPAPAVARQVARVLEATNRKNLDIKPGQLKFYTSGKSDRFKVLLKKLLNETHPAQEVSWDNYEIRIK
jgi:glutamate racemase